VNRFITWSIALLLVFAVWLLGIHLLVWAARTFGLVPAAGGLVLVALVALALSVAGAWRDRREARQPWRSYAWAEKEALR
jgi:O-antigen ligase